MNGFFKILYKILEIKWKFLVSKFIQKACNVIYPSMWENETGEQMDGERERGVEKEKAEEKEKASEIERGEKERRKWTW